MGASGRLPPVIAAADFFVAVVLIDSVDLRRL